jgi:hypothetical protein
MLLCIYKVLGGCEMTVVKEERKNRVFRFTDTEVSLIDELIDIENDKRMTIAREKNLKYKALNRTSFILYMAEERRRKYEEQGEF